MASRSTERLVCSPTRYGSRHDTGTATMNIRLIRTVVLRATWLVCTFFAALSMSTGACAAPPGKSAEPADKVYAIVTARVLPGKYRQFMKLMEEVEVDLGREHGVKLLASYQIEHGEVGEVVDIWEAPDYNSLARVFFADPELFTAEFGAIFGSINIKTAFLNPLKYRE